MAKGAAMSGVIQTVGENVCGMDHESVYTKGKVTSSPDLAFRVKSYKELTTVSRWHRVQTNVEDQRGGVDEYALSKLEVDIIGGSGDRAPRPSEARFA